MNSKEKFKRTFSVVRTSEDYCKGVYEMNHTHTKRFYTSMAVAACLVLCLAFGAMGVCYAANVGGIQRQIQLWVNGDQTDAVIEFSGEGTYSLEYTDVDGGTHSQSGGGVAFDAFGNERPLTEEELLAELNAPDVRYEEGGKVMLYYYGQATDITDMFEEDICYIKLVNDSAELYMTIKYQNGYATSPDRYMNPKEFN